MRTCILFWSLLLLQNVQAQTNKTGEKAPAKPKLTIAAPESAGYSSERLNRIDANVQQWINENKMNGAVAFIARDGKIVYNKAFGVANLNTKEPMSTEHIFRIASQTKAITSLAIMMLYEEGKLMLNDPVSKFIPEFKNPKVIEKFNLADTTWTSVPAKREITIKDLLTHTSGIAYAQIGSKEANAMYAKNNVVSGIGMEGYVLGDMIKRLATLPLFHNPGEKFTYGLNNDVLGYVVEVASNMSFDKFLRTRVFEPLGMKDTYFFIPKEKASRLVGLHEQDDKGVRMKEETMVLEGTKIYRDYPLMNGSFYSGGGGLSSTIKDYAIFLQMLLNGGSYNGKQLLSPTTVRMMTSNQIGENVMGGDEFSLGFGLTTPKESAESPLSVGSFEWGGMFATSYWADPKEKIVALFFRNIWPTNFDAGGRFKVLTYQALSY
ncbi:MAG: serine hydrolase domain-containing protein [Chitinophagaceae bacterium]